MKGGGWGKRAAGKLTDEAIITHPHRLGHVKLRNRTRLCGALLAENLCTCPSQIQATPRHRGMMLAFSFFSVLAVICTGEVIKKCRNTCGSMPENTTSCVISNNLHSESRRPRVCESRERGARGRSRGQGQVNGIHHLAAVTAVMSSHEEGEAGLALVTVGSLCI